MTLNAKKVRGNRTRDDMSISMARLCLALWRQLAQNVRFGRRLFIGSILPWNKTSVFLPGRWRIRASFCKRKSRIQYQRQSNYLQKTLCPYHTVPFVMIAFQLLCIKSIFLFKSKNLIFYQCTIWTTNSWKYVSNYTRVTNDREPGNW